MGAIEAETSDGVTSFRWKVVWTAFAVAVFAWGTGFYGPSIFLDTLHVQHGWPIATISTAITAHFLFSAILIVRLPEAHRRFGIATVTQGGLVLLALGILAWASARAPWQLFAAALLSGAGWAATSGAAINAMVAPWFDKDRPRAISFAFNGASIGGLIFAPLWVGLIDVLGFIRAAILIGVVMLAVLWPMTSRFLRPPPQQAENKPPAPTLSSGALVRDTRFLSLSAAFAFALFAQIGLFAHLVVRLAPEFGTSGAAAAISLVTLCAVAGRSILARALGQHDRRIAAAINFAVQACGTVLLTFAHGVPALLAGCVLFGLGVGNLVSLPPLIVQKEFAAGDVHKVVALIVAINQAVFALAPAVLGSLRDLQGTYVLPFALAAGVQALAALIVIAPLTSTRRATG